MAKRSKKKTQKTSKKSGKGSTPKKNKPRSNTLNRDEVREQTTHRQGHPK